MINDILQHVYEVVMELTPDEKMDVDCCPECGSKPVAVVIMYTEKELDEDEKEQLSEETFQYINKKNAIVAKVLEVNHNERVTCKYVCTNKCEVN